MNRKSTIGIDIGGSKIMAGFVSPSGSILKEDRRRTEADKGKKAVIEHIFASIEAVLDDRTAAIGVGIAGSVDTDKGIYRQGPNFPSSFKNIPLAALIRRRFRLPTIIDNDVHCFTLGEARFGAAKGKKTVVGITLGTGVGGGIVIDGSVFRGKNNTAGEVGHATVDLTGARKCSCGRLGHLEAVASGKAMARRYTEVSGRDLKVFWDLEEKVARKEKAAVTVVTEAAVCLGAGIASYLHVLDPDIIVIGGGSTKMRPLMRGLRANIRRHLAYPHLSMTPIVPSKFGDAANVLGAAQLARMMLK